MTINSFSVVTQSANQSIKRIYNIFLLAEVLKLKLVFQKNYVQETRKVENVFCLSILLKKHIYAFSIKR